MIKKHGELRNEVRTNMRDGNGDVKITHLAEKENLYGKGRLFAEITLEEGCSIGYHVHETDSEIFYITKGNGVYSDNGTDVAVEAGDVLICPAGEGHSIRNNDAEALVLTAVIICL